MILGVRHPCHAPDRRCLCALTGTSAYTFLGLENSISAGPKRGTLEHAQEDLREGKSPSTAAGEFVREEMHHIREGKHGAASTKQAIAIGLSKARRAGVPLKQPDAGTVSDETRKAAARDTRRG